MVAEYVSVSAFASLVGVPIEITSSPVRLETCTIHAAMTRYKKTIKKLQYCQQKLNKKDRSLNL